MDLDTTADAQNSRRLLHGLFGLLLLAYLLGYWTTLKTLVGVWGGDGTFQYAFLIVPIALFLVWERRRKVSACDFAPSRIGALLVGGWMLCWLAGTLIGVQLVQHFAVVALLPSLVLAVYGGSVARVLLFPLLYLFFAFPWPVGGLTALLQQITAEFSVRALQLTGFTTVLQGVVIETPYGNWHVAEACSGIKFFIASLALGALYANLFYRSWRRRLIFMVFAFVVPIVANGFRVYFTIVIGEVFGVQYATGTDHLIFGWQFFGTVLLLLFISGWRWREEPLTEPKVATPGLAALRPVSGTALGLLLLAGPLTAAALSASTPPSVATVLSPSFGAWRLSLPRANPLGAHFRAPDALLMATYADGQRHVNLLRVAYLGRPREGHKLFLNGNRLYDGRHWKVIESRELRRQDRPQVMRELELGSGGQRRLAWLWYVVGEQPAVGLLGVKLLQLRDGLLARPVSTQLLMVSTPLLGGASGHGDATASLRAFLQAYEARNPRHRAETGG